MKIAKFTRNYRQLATLIKRSWLQEHSNHIDYTPEYLEYLLAAPDIETQMTLGAYHEKTLIGFVLSKRKTILISGTPYKALFTTLATAHPQYAFSFPYLKIKDQLSRHAIAMGYDAVCGYAAWGIKNNEIEALYARRKGHNCFCVSSFASLICSLRTNAETSSQRLSIRDFQPNDSVLCKQILDKSVLPCDFCESPSTESLEYRLMPSLYGNTKIIEIGDLRGFINYSILQFHHVNFQRKLALVYNLFLHDFSPRQSEQIMVILAQELRGAGIEGISIPNTGYFDVEFLKQLGFREPPFTRNKTNLYITFFKKEVKIAENLSFYMEIM